MLKKTFLTAFAAVLFLFNSCGNKDITLTPESTEVKGDLKEYFTVVDKQFIVKYDEKGIFNKYIISIELQRTDVPFKFNTEGIEPMGTYGQSVNGNFGIGLELRDKDGNIVNTWSPTATGFSGVYSHDDLSNLLRLESGETGQVRWSYDGFKDRKDKEFTFKVSSCLEIDKSSYSSSSKGSNSSNEWDSVIDSYEQFVNEYTAILKKVNSGDMSSYSEMAELMEKYQELAEKIEAASDELSSKQLKRFNKINSKLSSAIL
jgi:O6-methylguanine-DNA--protein-cysteine methyltransferase